MLIMYRSKDFKEFNDMLKDMFADGMQQALESDLEADLGYTKYNYRNKETMNTEMGKGRNLLRPA